MNDTVIESFRTAVGGFHKGDVTNYIARTAAEYDKKLKLKESENSFLRQKNELLESKLNDIEKNAGDDQQEKDALLSENEALKAQVLRLKEQLAERDSRITAMLSVPARENAQIQEPTITDLELAAYRRAESAERIAMERAKRINGEVQTLFVDAVEDFEAADEKISNVIDALSAQLAAVEEIRNQLEQNRSDVQQQFETVCGREFFQLQKEEN